MKKVLLSFFCLLVIGLPGNLFAQQETALAEIEGEAGNEGATLLFGADLMSRYIWRGYDYGNSPAIQPNIAFSWKGLNVGAWGSYAFTKHSIELNDTTIIDAGNYAETDLYISYTYKWFTLLLYDYFNMNGLNANDGNQYFNYNNATTGHTFEGCLIFDGPEQFPLQVTLSTLFYGADKDQDSTGVYGYGTNNNYSTYFELACKIHLKKIDVELKPFIGGIPFGSSWYGPYAGVINLGLTAKRSIPITPLYSLPVQASLVTNPQAQSIFLVFGVSL